MKIMIISSILMGSLLIGVMNAGNTAKVMLLNGFDAQSKTLAVSLQDGASKAGFDVELVEPGNLSTRLESMKGDGSTLILPDSVSFPAEAKAPLLAFLKNGNHLIAISGPSFSKMLVNADGKWVTRDDAKEALANAQGTKIIDFTTDFVTNWTRATGSPQNPTEYKIEAPISEYQPSYLHAKISKLDNWDNLGSPALSNPFGSDKTVTTFAAKGGPNTPELVIEWKEKDGTRWMGVVKLTTEWKRYALTPSDFRFWPDGSPAGRGGANDRFKPENASIFTVGLSDGISAQKMKIAHEFWISDVCAVKDQYAGIDYTSPIIESISPQYKTYPLTAVDVKAVGDDKPFFKDADASASIQRSLGYGSDSVRKARQIPMFCAYDKNGEKRGIVGHLYVNTLGDYAGSIWGYLGISGKDIAKNPDAVIQIIISMLKRIDNGVFLSNAGTEFFAYKAGETIKTGAYITDFKDNPFSAEIHSVIESKGKEVKVLSKKLDNVSFKKNDPLQVSFNAGELSNGIYTVKTSIFVDGKKLDEISHEFQVIQYGRLTNKNTVTRDGADFMLNGKKWYPLGMNYWPRYSVGQEPSDYWLHWFSPEQYDPEMIEEDLQLANKLKMNLFSIQYGNVNQGRPLMDFLARAERYGIKVNVFMPGVHPLSQDFKTADAMITAANIAGSPAFFAYDLGWEVNIGPYSARQPFDSSWQRWVINQYGSIESAQKDWKYKAEQSKGIITGPSDKQLMNDGEWRIYVAAYRRFWDDEISKRYMQVRQNIRKLDKVHLMGARSGYGGTGSVWIADRMPFDLLSGAKHLDFISPEAYNIGGDRRGFLIGGFNAAYGRHFSGNKPIYWAEYGSALFYNIEPSNFKNEYTDEQYERERAYYEGLVRMSMDTFSNGSAGWWWPGGMRVDEKSDFGVINPDGTPRPAAIAISKLADEFYKPRTVPEPNEFIEVDRDKYVTGYAGVFGELSGKYVDILDKGRIPGVKTPGSGTTSMNVPLIAVGNLPYNGSNPMKFINSEFNWVKINGKIVNDNEIVEVEQGKPVYIEASIGNTGEAKWIASSSSSDGIVHLLVSGDGINKQLSLISDVPFLSDGSVKKNVLLDDISQKVTLKLRMTADKRAAFGDVMNITLDPK